MMRNFMMCMFFGDEFDIINFVGLRWQTNEHCFLKRKHSLVFILKTLSVCFLHLVKDSCYSDGIFFLFLTDESKVFCLSLTGIL